MVSYFKWRSRLLPIAAREQRPQRWRYVWSAGHSASGVMDVPAVENLIARTIDEYRAADSRGGAFP
jgi:nitronate monooxygenase